MEPGWRQAIAVAVASNRPHVARKFLAGMQPTDQRTSMYVYPTPPGRDGSWLSEALWAVAAFAARNESTVAFAAPASTGDAPPAIRTTSVTVCLLQSISDHLRPHAVELVALEVLRAAESPLSLSSLPADVGRAFLLATRGAPGGCGHRVTQKMVSKWYNASSIRRALPRRSDWLTRAAEPEDLLLGHFAVVDGTTLVDARKQVQTLVAAAGAGLSRKATGASVTYRCLARKDIKPREALRWGSSQENAALLTAAGVDLSDASEGDHRPDDDGPGGSCAGDGHADGGASEASGCNGSTSDGSSPVGLPLSQLTQQLDAAALIPPTASTADASEGPDSMVASLQHGSSATPRGTAPLSAASSTGPVDSPVVVPPAASVPLPVSAISPGVGPAGHGTAVSGRRYQAQLPDERYVRSVAARAHGEVRVHSGLKCPGRLRLVELGTTVIVFSTAHCNECVSRCGEWVRSQAPDSVLGRLFPMDPRAQATLVAHLSMAGMKAQPTTVMSVVNAMLSEARSFDRGDVPGTFEACAIRRACAACAQTGTDSTAIAKGASLKMRQQRQLEALQRSAPPAYIGVQRMYVSKDDVCNLKRRLYKESSVGDQSSLQEFVDEYSRQGLTGQREVKEGDEHVQVRLFMHRQVPDMVARDLDMLRVLNVDDTFNSAGSGAGALLGLVCKSSVGDCVVPLGWATLERVVPAGTPHGESDAGLSGAGPKFTKASTLCALELLWELLALRFGASNLPIPALTVSDEAPEFLWACTAFKSKLLSRQIQEWRSGLGSADSGNGEEDADVAFLLAKAMGFSPRPTDPLSPESPAAQAVLSKIALSFTQGRVLRGGPSDPVGRAMPAPCRLTDSSSLQAPDAHRPSPDQQAQPTQACGMHSQATVAASPCPPERPSRVAVGSSPSRESPSVTTQCNASSRSALKHGEAFQAELAFQALRGMHSSVFFDPESQVYSVLLQRGSLEERLCFASMDLRSPETRAGEHSDAGVPHPPREAALSKSRSIAEGRLADVGSLVSALQDSFASTPPLREAGAPLRSICTGLRVFDVASNIAGTLDIVGVSADGSHVVAFAVERQQDLFSVDELESFAWQLSSIESIIHRATGLRASSIRVRHALVDPKRDASAVKIVDANGWARRIRSSQANPRAAAAAILGRRRGVLESASRLAVPSVGPSSGSSGHWTIAQPRASGSASALYAAVSELISQGKAEKVQRIVLNAVTVLQAACERAQADPGRSAALALWQASTAMLAKGIRHIAAALGAGGSTPPGSPGWGDLASLLPADALQHLHCSWHKNQTMVRKTSTCVKTLHLRKQVQRAWLDIRDSKQGIGVAGNFSRLVHLLADGVSQAQVSLDSARTLVAYVRAQLQPKVCVSWLAANRSVYCSDASNNAAEGTFSGVKNHFHRCRRPRSQLAALHDLVGSPVNRFTACHSFGAATAVLFFSRQGGYARPSQRAALASRPAAEGIVITLEAIEANQTGAASPIRFEFPSSFFVQDDLATGIASAGFRVDLARRSCSCEVASRTTYASVCCRHFCAAYYFSVYTGIGCFEDVRDATLDSLWERATSFALSPCGADGHVPASPTAPSLVSAPTSTTLQLPRGKAQWDCRGHATTITLAINHSVKVTGGTIESRSAALARLWDHAEQALQLQSRKRAREGFSSEPPASRLRPSEE